MNGLLNQALQAEGRGWSVIPIQKRSKLPLSKWRSSQTVRLNAHELTDVFEKNPDSNLAFVTGKISGGLVVLDVDPRAKGNHSLKSLISEYGALPHGPSVKTGGGGFHYYFKAPIQLGSRTGKLGPGLDFKGEGGYIVAPPSVHASGSTYEWIVPPEQAPLPTLPDWIIDSLKARTPKRIVSNGDIPEGKRNTTLTSMAGAMIRKGFTHKAVESALLNHNQETCIPPLGDDEVIKLASNLMNLYEDKHKPNSDLNFLKPDEWLHITEQETEWLVEGLIPAGSLTILSAPPKVGKSTFARDLAVSVANGMPFLDKPVLQGEVLLLALEEVPSSVRTALRNLGVRDDTPLKVHFGQLTHAAMEELISLVETTLPSMLIIDTVSRIRTQNLDVNDYISTGSWLEPLLYLAHETGTAIVALYHDTKSGRNSTGHEAIFSIMGSVAISATADQMITLRRKTDGRRTFLTNGRFGDIQETALDFDQETQKLLATDTEEVFTANDLKKRIVTLLEYGELTQPQLLNSLHGNNQLVLSTLKHLVENGFILKSGSGVRGNPFSYLLPGN